MGLDTYAARSEREGVTQADVAAFEEAGIELCGGLFSGDGGSFRGKVYSDLVRSVTGVSLHQEWIPPETVEEMAGAFARSVCAASDREVLELAKFFRVCAERGLGLRGWW